MKYLVHTLILHWPLHLLCGGGPCNVQQPLIQSIRQTMYFNYVVIYAFHAHYNKLLNLQL